MPSPNDLQNCISTTLKKSLSETKKKSDGGGKVSQTVMSSAKRALLEKATIKFVKAEKDANSMLQNLKDKYICLHPTTSPEKINGHTKSDTRVDASKSDGFPKPKLVLYPPEKVNLQWKTPRKVGAGLSNLGNTCFLNSVLQCLTYTAPLANHLIDNQHKPQCRSKGFCVLCELHSHVNKCLTQYGGAMKPLGILQKLKMIAKHMRWGRQEDAHEFLRYTVDAMQKACLAGHSASLEKLSKETTLMHQVFGGYLRSQVRCLQCKTTSNTYDPMLDLSIDLKGVNSLDKALQRFVQPETLDVDNAYKCPRCKKKVRALKQFTIHRPPKVLTIHLKRFDYHRLMGGKVSRHIDFSKSLDIRPYMSSKQASPVTYQLYAVLVHSGYSCNSGHYYCYVKAANQTWYCMNDSHVSQTGLNSVLSSEAYILFYSLTSPLGQGRMSPLSNGVKKTVNGTAQLTNGKPAASSSSQKAATPLAASSSSQKAATPLAASISNQKAATPLAASSSSQKAATPLAASSSSQKTATLLAASSSSQKAATPLAASSSSQKTATLLAASSSSQKAATPLAASSSSQKAATPLAASSSSQKAATPLAASSSSQKTATLLAASSSSQKAATPLAASSSSQKAATPLAASHKPTNSPTLITHGPAKSRPTVKKKDTSPADKPSAQSAPSTPTSSHPLTVKVTHKKTSHSSKEEKKKLDMSAEGEGMAGNVPPTKIMSPPPSRREMCSPLNRTTSWQVVATNGHTHSHSESDTGSINSTSSWTVTSAAQDTTASPLKHSGKRKGDNSGSAGGKMARKDQQEMTESPQPCQSPTKEKVKKRKRSKCREEHADGERKKKKANIQSAASSDLTNGQKSDTAGHPAGEVKSTLKESKQRRRFSEPSLKVWDASTDENEAAFRRQSTSYIRSPWDGRKEANIGCLIEKHAANVSGLGSGVYSWDGAKSEVNKEVEKEKLMSGLSNGWYDGYEQDIDEGRRKKVKVKKNKGTNNRDHFQGIQNTTNTVRQLKREGKLNSLPSYIY